MHRTNAAGVRVIFRQGVQRAPQIEYCYVDGATFIDYEDTGAISGCTGCCSPQKYKQGVYHASKQGGGSSLVPL
jgi:hypothetical protein